MKKSRPSQSDPESIRKELARRGMSSSLDDLDKGNRQLVRRCIIVASICISLFVMYFLGMLILGFTVSSYSIAAALLLPWTCGLFGIVGLARSWPDTATKSANRLRQDIVLLGLGMIGAMVVVAAFIAFVASYSSDLTVSGFALLLAYTLPFPSIQIAFACVEIRKSVIFMRRAGLADKPKMRNFYLILLLSWLLVVAARIIPQEAVMMWYGRDLVSSAHLAADRLANGRPYCVMGFGGVDTFEEMDKRQLVLSAIEKRFSNRNGGIDPHFGITFENEVYWWSFKRRDFLPLYSFRELPSTGPCAATEQ